MCVRVREIGCKRSFQQLLGTAQTLSLVLKVCSSPIAHSGATWWRVLKPTRLSIASLQTRNHPAHVPLLHLRTIFCSFEQKVTLSLSLPFAPIPSALRPTNTSERASNRFRNVRNVGPRLCVCMCERVNVSGKLSKAHPVRRAAVQAVQAPVSQRHSVGAVVTSGTEGRKSSQTQSPNQKPTPTTQPSQPSSSGSSV